MTDNIKSPLVPDGWAVVNLRPHFSKNIGPLYLRTDPVGLGFVTNETHSNSNDVVHGGALATLADIGLFFIATKGRDKMNGATLSLNLSYLRPGKINRFIHCEGRVVREGSSIVFVEGSLFDSADEIITFNGVIKRFR